MNARQDLELNKVSRITNTNKEMDVCIGGLNLPLWSCPRRSIPMKSLATGQKKCALDCNLAHLAKKPYDFSFLHVKVEIIEGDLSWSSAERRKNLAQPRISGGAT